MMKKNIFSFLLLLYFSFPLFSQEIKSVKTFKNLPINDHLIESQDLLLTIQPYRAKLRALTEVVLAKTDDTLSKKPPECGLGRLLAYFMLEEANDFAHKNKYPSVDMAFLGYGGIRKKLYPGPITVGNIYEVMPFENYLVIVALKGKYLKDLLEVYLKSELYHPSAGLRLIIKKGRILEAAVQNQPIRPDKTYYIATANYWANGGDNMSFFKQGLQVNTHQKLRDVFIRHFALVKYIDTARIPPLLISIQKSYE